LTGGLVPPGRYWHDANGNVGYEGQEGWVLANLLQLQQSRGASSPGWDPLYGGPGRHVEYLGDGQVSM
jgi:hypothetical protein